MKRDYELIVVSAADDWACYHAIRKAELFDDGRHDVTYERDHPDEVKPNHFPLLLKWGGVAIATARLDVLEDGGAVVRLVAVKRSEQGKGHGRALNAMVSDFARSRGVGQLFVNAAPEAVGYYERMGFGRASRTTTELDRIVIGTIWMSKPLR